MLTREEIFKAELELLPEVVYPAEVVERWYKEGEIALQQYAMGELEPLDLTEFAAKHGLKLNG